MVSAQGFSIALLNSWDLGSLLEEDKFTDRLSVSFLASEVGGGGDSCSLVRPDWPLA